MKFLIIGHSQHGKDTVAEIINKLFGMTFISSSLAAAEQVVMPALKNKHGYSTADECFKDRHNHRIEWRDLIAAYNTPDKSKLCGEVLKQSDAYVGMRCPLEYEATKELFDLVIWVENPRKPDDISMGIEYDSKKMLFIYNDGSIADLENKLYYKLSLLDYLKSAALQKAS